MKAQILTILFGLGFLVAGASSAFAWGQTGHRITGEIAERNLTPKALAALRRIAGDETLAELSTWPDEIRSEGTWDFVQPWHYISIDDDETWEGLERSEDGDVLDILETLEKFLRDPAAKTMTLGAKVQGKGSNSSLKIDQKKKIGKREALAFYSHFLADLHQPLHVGRRDDAGGNRILVEWFDEEISLHRLWDESLIESTRLSYTEFATILNRVPGDVQVKWSKSSYFDWADESKAVRSQVYDFGAQRSSYYLNINEAPSLGYDYRHKNMPVVRDRLTKAGIRLASRLNEFFANYPE